MIQFQKPNKRYMTIALVMIVVGFVGIGLGIYRSHSLRADETTGQPNFSTLLPGGKTIDQLGGWQKLEAPNGDAFYVYIDTVSGVTVNVTEQKLPGKFKNDLSNELTNMARNYNANVKLDADGTTVYVGTSAKGPQSVIFAKDNVLVLIKSWATISDADWITYIKTLRT